MLQLSSNRLSGSLPAAWQHLSGLEQLALHSNGLTGTLPSNAFCQPNLAALLTVDLSQNRFCGSLPVGCSSTTNASSCTVAAREGEVLPITSL